MAYIPLSIWLQRMEQHWGWLADGIIWQFWMPVERVPPLWRIIAGMGDCADPCLCIFFGKKEYVKYLKIATSRTSCGIIMTT